ncbi:glycosyltransferase family 2 protein [Luteolibacter sp. SL250]|uniref:glycosyltransferase family 2 protein n=1 Tax=Luteolibacter sp. SL250 TaxID=2995170 RepID=UPI00226EC35A|nr:glycosyltransferase family 2 protein [Luteolibacter sp. SL250]WAC19633.1 glycosyltransferase family 2 protein [Luteolibacter sp. SL250]
MDLTFLFPCLNEAETLAYCINEVRKSLEVDESISFEILVADNGSTDESREIARANGARVVEVGEKGYGAALRGGFEAAEGRYVMFADADATYMLEHSLELYRAAIREGADMAIASRLKGTVQPGAMPPIHHYLGTPVLTTLINLFFKGRLSDCNSGFRCVRKEAYKTWRIRSSGMEFASELLIKALKAKAKMVEIPSGLRPHRAGRVAHLKTWRDGMRHLLFILSERPQFFESVGLLLLIASTLLQVAALILGPVQIGIFNVFDVHSQALLLLGGLTGAQLYVFSCVLFLVGKERSTALTRKLLGLEEDSLFFLLLGLLLLETLCVGGIVVRWGMVHFGGLDLAGVLLPIIHFLSVPALWAIGLLAIHVFKKGEKAH